MQDRKFDPVSKMQTYRTLARLIPLHQNKPVGKLVQLYSTRIVVDTDQASRDCFKVYFQVNLGSM